MAGINLSRRKGFAFSSVVVDNQNGFCLLDVKGDASPDRSYFEYDVPKRNGSTYYSNKYKDKDIVIVVGIYAETVTERRYKQRELLSKIIGKKSRLSFLDEPTLYYEAEIFDGVEQNEDDIYTKLTIKFKCSYCKYGTNKTMKLQQGNNKVNNAGNYRSETVIKIKAIAACESVTVSNDINSFTLNSLAINDEVFVDSKNMIVYKFDGNKKSMLTQFTGKFLTVTPGSNNITVNGTNYNANIEVSFSDTYIV